MTSVLDVVDGICGYGNAFRFTLTNTVFVQTRALPGGCPLGGGLVREGSGHGGVALLR